jgi:transcriptional regulator with XRE-family HTH domain
MANMDKLTDKLKFCRTKKGWTLEQMARNVGVSLNTVQRWESGKTKPSPLAMEKLRQLFKEILEQEQIRLL